MRYFAALAVVLCHVNPYFLSNLWQRDAISCRYVGMSFFYLVHDVLYFLASEHGWLSADGKPGALGDLAGQARKRQMMPRISSRGRTHSARVAARALCAPAIRRLPGTWRRDRPGPVRGP